MKPSKVHVYKVFIREGHVDLIGHVNNATYLELFEEARWQMLADASFTLKEMMRLNVGPVILEIQIQFLKEIRLREEIVIKTLTAPYTGKVGELHQEMFNKNEELCCRATFKYGFLI